MSWLSIGILILSSCAKTAPPAAAAYESVLIEGVPHVRQRPDFCGEACAEMVLRKLGHDLSQDDVFAWSDLDPALGRGCYTADLKRALRAIGFETGDVWYEVNVDNANAELNDLFSGLHNDLRKNVPSIVCSRYDETPATTEHFRLVVGYDAESDRVIYHEPAVTDGAYRRMDRAKFLRLWPLKYHPERWTVIRIRMQPADILVAKAAGSHSPADFAQHVMALKKKLPDGFHIVVQPPFVVIGDESKAWLERRAERTVKWAVDRLKKDFFEKDPEHIIDIWLFKDDASYREHAKSLFGDIPHTPFGYYSEEHKALVMNIATGGGTLVHEIVHPFMKANFAACPSWLNEGLGSLYEQCSDQEGHIHGLTNWRLAGLQTAIRARDVPTFEALLSTTEHGFYQMDPGTNYAQARYLCYYLQQRGLLVRYFHEFRKNQAEDPTGYETLRKILGTDGEDMKAFQKKWEKFVLGLTFP